MNFDWGTEQFRSDFITETAMTKRIFQNSTKKKTDTTFLPQANKEKVRKFSVHYKLPSVLQFFQIR